jgi:glycosyltransferase involved in cell wall biosynthesis
MGQYIDHLLLHLPRYAAPVQWTVLLPVLPGKALPERALTQPEVTLLPLQLLALPRQLAKLWWEQVTTPLAARRLGADVLWAPYWTAPLWQPCPTVVTIHDLIPALLPEYRGNPLQRAYTALVSTTARRAAAVLTVSQASARDIVQHLAISAERVQVVYHGVNQTGDARTDERQRAAVRCKYRLPERYFLYLGGFDRRKNLHATITAYQRYLARGGDPAIHLVIAGQLPARDTPFAPDPQKIAAALELGDQIHCCGWVDESDKAAIYAQATAFVFPTLYEGFGMMAIEAMSAGTPVITSA